MPRFHADISLAQGGEIEITGGEARHISRVMRLCPGDPVTVFNGKGLEAECRIISASASRVVLAVEKAASVEAEQTVPVTLCQAVIKPDKMDQVIRHSVELGVSRIVPFISSRTVVSLDAATARHERWKKISIEAAKQCGRSILPEIPAPAPFESMVVGEAGAALKLILWEDEKFRLGSLHKSHLSPDKITLVAGPEGGFPGWEVELARAKGYIPVGIGRRILRSETASLAALAIIQFEFGDMG